MSDLEERAVSIAEETVAVGEGMFIDLAPAAVGEGADKEKERGLGLMEVCDELTHNFELIARSNDNLCGGMYG